MTDRQIRRSLRLHLPDLPSSHGLPVPNVFESRRFCPYPKISCGYTEKFWRVSATITLFDEMGLIFQMSNYFVLPNKNDPIMLSSLTLLHPQSYGFEVRLTTVEEKSGHVFTSFCISDASLNFSIRGCEKAFRALSQCPVLARHYIPVVGVGSYWKPLRRAPRDLEVIGNHGRGSWLLFQTS